MKVIKISGHCYDGMGWVDCDFWVHDKDESICMLFGKDGVPKNKSESLIICNKIYGLDYDGDA